MVSRYDFYLGALFGTMLGGAALSLHSAVESYQGLGGASLIGTLIMIEMLFRNPPTDAPVRTGTAVGMVGLGWLVTMLLL